MRLTVGDIAMLAESGTTEGADAIKQVYDWHRDFSKTIGLSLLGAALSLLAALSAAILKAEVKVDSVETWVATGATAIVIVVAAVSWLRSARLEREYLFAISLFALLVERRNP